MAGNAGWISGSRLRRDATHLSDAAGVELAGALVRPSESPPPVDFDWWGSEIWNSPCQLNHVEPNCSTNWQRRCRVYWSASPQTETERFLEPSSRHWRHVPGWQVRFARNCCLCLQGAINIFMPYFTILSYQHIKQGMVEYFGKQR